MNNSFVSISDYNNNLLSVIDAVNGIQEICRAVSYAVNYGYLAKPIETSYVLDALACVSSSIADQLAETHSNIDANISIPDEPIEA